MLSDRSAAHYRAMRQRAASSSAKTWAFNGLYTKMRDAWIKTLHTSSSSCAFNGKTRRFGALPIPPSKGQRRGVSPPHRRAETVAQLVKVGRRRGMSSGQFNLRLICQTELGAETEIMRLLLMLSPETDKTSAAHSRRDWSMMCLFGVRRFGKIRLEPKE